MEESGHENQSGWIATALAGACAGALSRIPCHPIDTCKARLQFQTMNARRYCPHNNFVGVFRHTARGEGLAGLYRGFGATLWGGVPAACLYFTVYEGFKTTIGPAFRQHESVVHFLSGLAAEAVSCLLFVPIDVVKERIQTQYAIGSSNATQNYRGSVDAIASIIRTDGIRGVYRGYGATVLSFGPFSALYFMFYEQLKYSGRGAPVFCRCFGSLLTDDVSQSDQPVTQPFFFLPRKCFSIINPRLSEAIDCTCFSLPAQELAHWHHFSLTRWTLSNFVCKFSG